MKRPILLGFLVGLAVLFYINSGSDHSEPSGALVSPGGEDVSLVPSEGASVKEPSSGEPVTGFAPSADSSSLSEELAREILKVKKALPSLKDLGSLPDDEVHGTPARIIEAGAALGELEEFLERKPEEFHGASRFFSECAVGEDLPASIRAMCLHSLRNNPTQWAPGVSARLESVPSEVMDLEAQL